MIKFDQESMPFGVQPGTFIHTKSVVIFIVKESAFKLVEAGTDGGKLICLRFIFGFGKCPELETCS
jgi:hypothetical protein